MTTILKGATLKALGVALAIPGRSKLKADELRLAIAELVGATFLLSQVHEGVKAGEPYYRDERLIGYVDETKTGLCLRLLDPVLAEQTKVIGGPGETSQLPVGSVVSYVDSHGVLKHYYKQTMPDWWVLAEADGAPVLGATQEDWLGDESRPPVSMHGVYFLGLGLGWPEGVPTRRSAPEENVAEEPQTTTARLSRAERHKVRANGDPRRTSDGSLLGEVGLKGQRLKQYRAARKKRKKQAKAAKRVGRR